MRKESLRSSERSKISKLHREHAMLSVRPIVSKEAWENFIAACKPNTFLQTWQWGEFNEKTGERVFRIGIYINENLAAVALIIKIRARRGSFLFCPHGPIFAAHCPADNIAENTGKQEILKILTEYVVTLAKKENALFIRISPLQSKSDEILFSNLGFRNAATHMHPELAWILDVTQDEETLLKNMRKTMRYGIRKAGKDGVEIIKSENPDDVEVFWNVYGATFERENFIPFSKEYLRAEFETFAKEGKSMFFFGKYNKEVVTAAMIIFSEYEAFYHHGASVRSYPKITAPYLLQWEIIKETKKRGCGFYNFWGIAPEDEKNHPWAGLSLFKKGFGGFSESYIHAKDFVLSPKYWFTYGIEKIRRIKRGL